MALDEAFWTSERELLFRALFPLVLDAAIDGARTAMNTLYADIGIGVDWGLVNEAARRWAQDYTADLVRRITDTSRDYVRGAVADWIQSGAPLDDLTATLEPMFGRVRAEMIASTEVTRAYAAANRDVWKESGVVEAMEWRTAEDELVCPICGPLAGTVVDLGGRFGDKFEIPPAHVRCILPGNEVIVPGQLSAAAKSFYVGRCVEISLGDGRRLSVTENHPILTPRGWVAAQFICEGDDVMVTGDGQRIASAIHPDDDHHPAIIEQVFHSLEVAADVTTARVEVAAEDFYGDGRNIHGDVHIVGSNRLLRRDIQPVRAQAVSEGQFNGRGPAQGALIAERMGNLFSPRDFSAARRSVGLCQHTLPHGFIGLLPADTHGFRAAARRDASGKQSLAERPAVDTQFIGKGLFGLAGLVASKDAIKVGDVAVARVGAVPVIHTKSLEGAHDGLRAASHLARKFTQRFASLIAPSKVVNVRQFDFSGHVYDLQVNPYELYICNGIIVKNCRCWLQPVVDRDKAHERTRLRDTGTGGSPAEIRRNQAQPTGAIGAPGQEGGAVRAPERAALPAATGDEHLPPDGDAGAQRDQF